MTRRRWIADEVSGSRAALTGEHARHLSQALRARVGEEFDIAVGGQVRHGRISSIDTKRVEFELGAVIAAPTAFIITVALSIFKFDRMEWAIEKCTELGAAKIIPVIAARTETHLASAAIKRTERWKRIAHAASEQSRRVTPPEISKPIKVNQLLTGSSGARIVLSEIEDEAMLKDLIPEKAASLALAFGPEGGWKQEEMDSFHNAGWTSASLGQTILRAETAAIAAVAIAASVLHGK
jgi:16S rRNA (uracil1498-N3)-methyltransferase